MIVVDNASTDDSVARIDHARLADELIVSETNRGFAGGNNVGIRRALDERFELIGVLNNDTVVEESFVEEVLEALAADEARAISPDVRYYDRPAESWFAGGVIDRGWPRHLQPHELKGREGELHASEWLSGCCVVARREVWETVGFFDERYFLIFEDCDWSMRARKNGVALQVVSKARIHHRVSRSFDTGGASLLGAYYFVRNGLRFEWSHFRGYLFRFTTKWVVRDTLTLLRHQGTSELLFRWAGAFAFVRGRSGPAGRGLERLAAHIKRRHAHRGGP